MLAEWNTRVLDLGQQVLVRRKYDWPDDKGHWPSWARGTLTNMALNEHDHSADTNPYECDGRRYTIKVPSNHTNHVADRCTHWVIPADSMGRWIGQQIERHAELQLCWFDNVENEPEGVESGIVMLTHEQAEERPGSEVGQLRLERPDTTLLAVVEPKDLLEWALHIY